MVNLLTEEKETSGETTNVSEPRKQNRSLKRDGQGKKMNESLKMIIVLGLLALIASAMLAVVNYYTKIDENQQIKDEIDAVYPSGIRDEVDVSSISDYMGAEIKAYFIAEDGANIIVAKANKADKVCYNAAGITIIVIIKEGKIDRVLSFSHSETPGLGEKALREDYLDQYNGINTDLIFIPEGEFISSSEDSYFNPSLVSGATYSSNGVSLAVKAAVRAYRSRGN
ncbi:MAG: electron transport complex protein RnfG [Firmicutes bacterium ADurb.Bin080]|jgi:Na+-translocating ferredoxin:NAD+ oxidoreductase subunit G|nr:FMN-binding protein [Clostridiales bacterium]OQC16020.1 MAG: electron transport complex protein RnfG [Firmicutes bacterium ADurb.Bin080]